MDWFSTRFASVVWKKKFEKKMKLVEMNLQSRKSILCSNGIQNIYKH